MIFFGYWPLVAKRTCIKGGFHDVHALFHIVVHSMHTRCLIKCLLGIFSLVWTLMSTKIWSFSCFLIRNMFGSLVVYLRHFAPHCVFHALVMQCTLPPLAHTFATLVMHQSTPCFFILACHVYLILCSILFCLRFELHFLIHLAPLIYHYHCSYLHLLLSFLLDPFVYSCKKGGRVYSKVVYQRVLSFLYDSCARSQGEKFYFSCTFVGGVMFHKGDAYTKGEKTLC